MKIAVRYQTIGGNTRLVADTIANVAGVKAKNIKYCEIKLPLKVFFKNYGGVTKNTVKLNENQILKVRNFAEKIIKSLAPKNEDKS